MTAERLLPWLSLAVAIITLITLLEQHQLQRIELANKLTGGPAS